MSTAVIRASVPVVLSFAVLAAAQPRPVPEEYKREDRIFVFHTDEFWLNLHHFLYVLARAQNKERDAARTAVAGAPADQETGMAVLKPKEKTAWREAVDFYAAGHARKSVFDEPMPAIGDVLAKAGNSRSLQLTPKIDAATLAVLRRAAPVYRKAWWPRHRKANHAWEAAIREQLKLYGDDMLGFLTKSYGLTWAAGGYPVHVAAYSNWAGAYSITGGLLVMSSLAEDLTGAYGLETVFHEGMHQWDNRIEAAIADAARKAGQAAPEGLSHALVFYTAGEAARRTIPGHMPYAEKFGIWNRGLARFKKPLDEIWKPYLDGRGTRDAALADLVARTGQPRLLFH